MSTLNEELAAKIDDGSLVTLLSDLVDATFCRHDHHGYCQEHGWFITDQPCPQKRLYELLQGAAIDVHAREA